MEANKLAAEFYSKALAAPEALEARRMLDGRGFDRPAAEHFGVGYAPVTDAPAPPPQPRRIP